jgi:hypothetical protein
MTMQQLEEELKKEEGINENGDLVEIDIAVIKKK